MALRKLLTGFRLMAGEWFNPLYDQVDANTAAISAISPASGNIAANNLAVAGNLGVTGFESIAPQIVAAAGSNSQANATAITKSAVVITTVSATTRALRLPVAVTGRIVQVFNRATSQAAKIFPATGARIGLAATNALGSARVAFGSGNIYVAESATRWSVLKGA